MHQFIKHFVRDPDGAWRCVSNAEYQGPSGRIQVVAGSRFTRGTNFMGVDLAQLLDEQAGDGLSADDDAPEPSARHTDGKGQLSRPSLRDDA